MDTIGLVGISARDQSADVLARFTWPKEERIARLPALRAELGVAELLYLATCNRVEIVFRLRNRNGERDLRRAAFRALTGSEPASGEGERTLRGWVGEGAVEHLFLVASGLDSMQVGEREVQGQLREALEQARAAGTAGVLVDRLAEEALRVAHQVHRETRLGSGRTSLAEIAVDHLLERVRRTPSPVALVGVSPMTERAAEALAREGTELVIVNRSRPHAEALAARIGGARLMTLAELRTRPPAVEALLTATGAPEAILDRPSLERLAGRTPSGEAPLVVDLAIPPDVDPETARAAGVPRIGMDEINAVADRQRGERLGETAAAREMVDQALRDLRERLAERLLAPVLARLNQRYRRTALEGVERLLAKEGFAIDPAAHETLERWAETSRAASLTCRRSACASSRASRGSRRSSSSSPPATPSWPASSARWTRSTPSSGSTRRRRRRSER
jgi:glutamyl-tRNA reductase